MAKNPPSEIKESELVNIRLSTLVLDYSLSGRTEKEITANAKDLLPMIKARGEWDKSQPGQVFVRDGKNHLVAGYTRRAACEMADIKSGWFIVVPDDPAVNRTACIRTNAGKNISPVNQGRLFISMLDGTDAATLKKGEVALAPMKGSEIAKQIGCSDSWVTMCVAMAKSSPEVQALIESGKVAAGIVYDAKKLAKDDSAKQLKILNRCIEEADKEGKETATKKHFDAIKGEFAPKLKAVSDTKNGGDAPTVKSSDVDSGSPAGETPAPEEKAEKEEKQDKEGKPEKTDQPESVLNLGTPAPEKKADKKDHRAKFDTILSAWGDDRGIAYTDDDADDLYKRLRALDSPI